MTSTGLAVVLAASLVLLSPGVGAYEALASVIRVPATASTPGISAAAVGGGIGTPGATFHPTGQLNGSALKIGALLPGTGAPIAVKVNGNEAVPAQKIPSPASMPWVSAEAAQTKRVLPAREGLADIGRISASLVEPKTSRSHADVKNAADFTLPGRAALPISDSVPVDRSFRHGLRSGLLRHTGDTQPEIPDFGVEVPQAKKPAASVGGVFGSVRGFAGTIREMVTGDKELAEILRPYRGKIAWAATLLVLDGALAIGLSYMVGPLLDTAILAGTAGLAVHADALWMYAGAIVGTFALYIIIERAHNLLSRLLAIWAARDYRVVLKRVLLGQSMDFHGEADHGSGALSKRLKDDTGYLAGKNVEVRISLLHYGLYAVFGITLMLYTHIPMALMVLSIVPILGYVNGKFGSTWMDLSYEIEDEKAGLMAGSQEILSQAATIKSFGTEKHEVDRYARKADRVLKLGEKNAALTADYTLLSTSLGQFFTEYLLYIFGSWVLAAAWGLSFGQITQMTLLAFFVKYAFDGLSHNYLSFKQYSGKTEVIRGWMRGALKNKEPAAEPLADVKGDIRFEAVTFGYTPGEPVLEGLTFHAHPGETIAFVGATGSGKSTVANLLVRLWSPDSGRIVLDGRELSSVDRKAWLDRVAVVPQDTRLFNESIRYNMTYGSEAVSEADLKKAIGMAKADFVFNQERFPEGLETPVAEGGDRLSGGERQRIAIVRAFLRTPSVLILDEATSALDTQSEAVVQAALNDLVRGKDGNKPTTFVIAHRLSTIRGADRILVLDKGRLAESGTHEELLERDGLYADLLRAQGENVPEEETAKEDASEKDAEVKPQKAEELQGPSDETAAARVGIFRRAFRMVRNFIVGDAVVRPFLKPQRKRIYATMALLIAHSGLWIAASHMTGMLLDTAGAAAQTSLALHWTPMLILSSAIAVSFVVSLFVERKKIHWTGLLDVRLARDIRVALKERILQREMAFHISHDSGEIASRLNDDVDSLAVKNIDIRLPLLNNVLFAGASAGLMLYTQPMMSLMVFVFVPLLGVVSGVFGHFAEAIYEIFVKRRAELGRHAQEVFEQIKTVKIFGREDYETKRYGQKAQALVDIGEKDARLGANAHVIASGLTEFFTRYMIYIVGAWVIGAALGMTIGQITQMTFYSGFIKIAFDQFSDGWMKYRQTHGATHVIRGWLGMTTGIKDGTEAIPPMRGEVEFEDISFSYTENGAPILSDFSLKVAPGETVAFVGESGSGKSTVLRLLQRLWDPSAGRVKIDGHELSGLTLASLTRDIALVPQESRLFDESIRYNMTYGTDGVTQEQLRAAIRAANADFVSDGRAFPEGLETRVGEGGSRLSGGQRQRVAIVRAILKKPRILLLDEATSALDKGTEREVQKALDAIRVDGKKPTTLVVAHNLTTIMNSDRIVVMDKGRIAETGTHRQLLSKDGIYRRLWELSQRKK